MTIKIEFRPALVHDFYNIVTNSYFNKTFNTLIVVN